MQARARPTLESLLLGSSPAIVELRRQIRALARAPLRSLLVLGETGVGKDLVARGLQACAPGRRPFEVFNCPAVPQDHLESELFGTARGAYPGALDRPGLVERSDGGLLFLDEIGSLAPAHQAKVLRFLESGEARRLGASRGYRVRATVVAASQADLKARVADGRFREDLYYRLVQDAVVQVPPLRERPADVAPLARAFLARLPGTPELTAAALARLERHSWPGNVRELRAVLSGAARLASGPQLTTADVEAALRRIGGLPAPSAPDSASFQRATSELRRQLLIEALTLAGGNQTRAGLLLGMHGGSEPQPDLRARKRAHRRFRYWWRRLVDEAGRAPTPVSRSDREV